MMEAADVADVDDDANTSELVRLYFHVDPRTNVAFLTGPDERVVESYAYDPYGNVTIRDQAGDPVAASPVGNPFTFQRRRLDEETGLYYFRARHYDPVAGQWMQRDPLGLVDGSNLRESLRSCPISWVDPLGTESFGAEVGEALDTATQVGPADALIAKALADSSMAVAAKTGLPGARNGMQNAFLHCYWSCVLTKALGAEQAKAVTDTHEKWGSAAGRQGPSSERMDQLNNAEGRSCGETPGTCLDCCFALLNQGTLSWFLDPKDGSSVSDLRVRRRSPGGGDEAWEAPGGGRGGLYLLETWLRVHREFANRLPEWLWSVGPIGGDPRADRPCGRKRRWLQ